MFWDQVPSASINGVLRGYRIALFKLRTQELFAYYTVWDTNVFSLNITGLEVGEAYNARICAFTIKGNGNWSDAQLAATASVGN